MNAGEYLGVFRLPDVGRSGFLVGSSVERGYTRIFPRKTALADANGEILMDPNLPCKTCPWRVDQDSAVIPRYDHDKACSLLNTVGEGDDFRPIMACHNSTDTDTIACKGYLAREGWNNINVRLLLRNGEIENPSVVLQTCEDHNIELEPDYPTVLAKLAASNSV